MGEARIAFQRKKDFEPRDMLRNGNNGILCPNPVRTSAKGTV